MRIRIIAVIAVVAVLIALVSLCVCAAGYEYTISPSEQFTSVNYGDDLSGIADKLNMTTDELNSYFNKNCILYLAVSDDAKTQLRLSAFTDNFSSAVVDISLLDEEGLREFKEAVSADNENAFYTESSDGRKFIAVKNTLQDSGGTYTVTQYITICNNKTFYFSGYNEGDDTSDDIKSAFKSLTLREIPVDNNYDTYITLIIIGIVVFSALAIFLVIDIIRLNSKNNSFKVQKNED